MVEGNNCLVNGEALYTFPQSMSKFLVRDEMTKKVDIDMGPNSLE
jgi:hypothetical protein